MAGTVFLSANWSGYDVAAWAPVASVTDFTLLIDVSTFSAEWKAAVQSDGADIRITKEDGTTELAYDLIDWAHNSGAPTGWIRTLFTGASGTLALNLFVHVGYSLGTATAYTPADASGFGSDNAYDANWEAYYADGAEIDRTSNGRDATLSGGMTSGGVAGKIGSASDYDGIDDYADTFDATLIALPQTHEMTVMSWINPAVAGNPFAAWSFEGSDDLIFYSNDTNIGSGGTRIFWRDVDRSIINENGSDISGVWSFHTFVTRASDDHQAYRDGVSVGISTLAGSTGPFSSFRMGAFNTSSQFSNMQMNEVQIHSTVRTTAWISEEYAQSNDQATFWGTWGWVAATIWAFGERAGVEFMPGVIPIVGGDTLATDLLSYWSLEEAEGSTRVDSVGTAHMLEVLGTVESAAALQGQGANYPDDGLLSRLEYQPGTPSDYDLTGDFTIQCWVNLDVLVDRGGIFGKWGGGGSRNYILQNLSTGQIRYQSLMGDILHTLDSNTIISIGDWAHCVVTRDLATDSIKLYINGVFDISLSGVGPISTATTPVNIGISSRDKVIGRVDECAIWTFALSAADVTNLYNAGAGRAFSELSGIPRS